MNVAITGANGLVGNAVLHELDPQAFNAIPLDLPEADATDYLGLLEATQNVDALIHLAWKELIPNVQNNTREPANLVMVQNAYDVAVANGIRRVIMGSSNQAHGYDVVDADGKIRPSTIPDRPLNEYGHEKLAMEALGKQYATNHGLEVICVRIGNVNNEDRPKPTTDGRPQRWLSKRDLGKLITACLTAKGVPDNFQMIYGVSNGSVFDPVNPFGFVPADTALQISKQ